VDLERVRAQLRRWQEDLLDQHSIPKIQRYSSGRRERQHCVVISASRPATADAEARVKPEVIVRQREGTLDLAHMAAPISRPEDPIAKGALDAGLWIVQ
jgi:hypothetical protein